eukprot:2981534-Amphidinium_carterae.1
MLLTRSQSSTKLRQHRSSTTCRTLACAEAVVSVLRNLAVNCVQEPRVLDALCTTAQERFT